jgi:hypothetical protein
MSQNPNLGYEPGFLQQLAYEDGAAAYLISEKRIKVVHNGGALNPQALAEQVDDYFKSLGISNCQVAWVSGDNLTHRMSGFKDVQFKHLDIEGLSLDTTQPILAANAYVGMAGIVTALNHGADIVICGRCTDASPVMGLAAWWHEWKIDNFKALARSLIAGHLIECSAYVTGGNYCGWREIKNQLRVGYPIAEIAWDGVSVITKHPQTNGAVTVDTCKAQLVYEIQGPSYLNPDVLALIDEANLKQVGENRVLVTGIGGSAPPPTTKLAVCLHGGYQAEIFVYFAGLDVDDKIALLRAQLMDKVDPTDYLTLSIEPYGGRSVSNPRTQAECTVQVRLFAQAKTESVLEQFKQDIFYNGMQGCCGFHVAMDWRTMAPRPFVRYFPAIINQEILNQTVTFLHRDKAELLVPKPPAQHYRLFAGQASYEPRQPFDLESFGQTQRRPLGEPLRICQGLSSFISNADVFFFIGDLVFARSGDKGGNANVGFWVRNPEAWPWLKSFLDSRQLIQLLGDDWKPWYRVERFEFPHLWAVHFVVYGILQEGIASSSILDGFAKSFGEFLRARFVDIPMELLLKEGQLRMSKL